MRVVRVWHVRQCHRKVVAREWRGETAHLKAVHVLQEQVGRWSVKPRQKSQQVGEAPGSGVVGSRLLPVTRIRLPCPDSPCKIVLAVSTLPRRPSTTPPAPHEGMAEPDKAGS